MDEKLDTQKVIAMGGILVILMVILMVMMLVFFNILSGMKEAMLRCNPLINRYMVLKEYP